MEKQQSMPFRMIGIMMILAVIMVTGCKKKMPELGPPEVIIVKITNKDVPVTKEWVGQTYGFEDIEVRARVKGWLTGMFFKEGSEVKKGMLLYTIDSTEMEQQVLEAKGNLAKAKTLLVQADADVKRYTPLAQAGAVSQRELDQALATYGARKGEVDTAAASLALARVNLGYTKVYSPITGLIGISAAKVGDYVGGPPNAIILNTVSSIDTIRVRFSITEQEYLYLVREVINKKKTGEKVKRDIEMILSDGSLYPHKGKVSFADRTIDPATGSLKFEAVFANPDHILRPGQFAKIRVVVATIKNAVVVPSRSLVEMQGRYLVYVMGKENKVEMRNVKIGPQYGQMTAIRGWSETRGNGYHGRYSEGEAGHGGKTESG